MWPRTSQKLQQLWHATEFSHIVFTGCGSTYYLSLAASALFQSLTGRAARAVPAGELVLYPETAYLTPEPGRTLLVAISRSGTTTETVTAVRQFRRQQRGKVVTITNYGDTPLAAMGDMTIALPKGQEESVAQTRSFASMYVAVTALIALWAGQEEWVDAMGALPVAGRRLLATYEGTAQQLGQDLNLDRFYFLGSGPRYGLACEVNLKMKEMTLTHSEPFHFLEFRHGPMSMVNNRAAVIGLLSDENRPHEQAVLDEMRKLGGHILSLGVTGADVVLDARTPAPLRNVLYLPVLQLVAYYRSIAKGLDPDRPTNLTSVIQLTSLPE